VWTNAHLQHKTEWTIHYDKVRNLYDEYKKRWPGADVRMQEAPITDVGDARTMQFGDPDA
jgi:hypothetical protein